mgnify:CR=1 FL=1
MDETPKNQSSNSSEEQNRPLYLQYLIKLLLGLAGGVLIFVGILLLFLPGPGWALIFSGLGLLAMEFVWARQVLAKTRERFEQEYEKWLDNKNDQLE